MKIEGLTALPPGDGMNPDLVRLSIYSRQSLKNGIENHAYVAKLSTVALRKFWYSASTSGQRYSVVTNGQLPRVVKGSVLIPKVDHVGYFRHVNQMWAAGDLIRRIERED